MHVIRGRKVKMRNWAVAEFESVMVFSSLVLLVKMKANEMSDMDWTKGREISESLIEIDMS
jgi:hypothetical protein